MPDPLPTGAAVRHPLWPEARWNVSGLFTHGRMIYDLYNLLRDRYGCRIGLDSVHGAPGVPWNSGRVSHLHMPTAQAMTATVKSFNDIGVGVFMTFSNHILDAGDLDHRDANTLLDYIDNDSGLNGVILSSDLLFDHIRKTHPNLKLTASVVKVTIEEGGGDLDYYRSHLERFDSVMLHPTDGFNYDLLAQLDPDRIEVLVNENCARNCPHRAEDYEHFALIMKAGQTDLQRTQLQEFENASCRMPMRNMTNAHRSYNFTTTEMLAAYELGYRRFKLQGRQDKPPNFLFDFLRYIIEPEIVMPIIFKAFTSGQAGRHALDAFKKAQAAGADANAPQPSNNEQPETPPVKPMVVEVPKSVPPNRLPTGPDAVHPLWPEARWNVSGLFAHGKLIYDVLAVLAQRFDCHPKIDGIHGAPGVPWNSGRLIAKPPPNFDALAEVIRRYNEMGVGTYYTFSNHLLEPDDLDDPVCNRMLEMIDNGSGLNGVILCSELLYDHVSTRHPKLKLTASVIKVTVEEGLGLADYYKTMTERFDSVMLHPDDGFEYDLLAELDPDRIEILINENCGLHCQVRADHYFRMASQQRASALKLAQMPTDRRQKVGCLMPVETLAGNVRSCNFTTAEMKRSTTWDTAGSSCKAAMTARASSCTISCDTCSSRICFCPSSTRAS